MGETDLLSSVLCVRRQPLAHPLTFGCSDQWDTWAEGKLEFVPLGPDYKGQTTTVLRSEGTYMPTAGAARVERNSSPETNFEPSSRPKL